MPDARDGPEPDHHFLADVEDREQQHEGPEQLHAVVLAHLRIDRNATRVVPAVN